MKYIIFALLPLLLSGCSSVPKWAGETKVRAQDYLLTACDFQKDAMPFSTKLAQKDMEVLLYFFRHGYSGYNFINQDIIKSTVDQLTMLPDQSTTSWVSLCSRIATVFKNVPDNHLRINLDTQSCMDKQLALEPAGGVGKNIAEENTTEPFFLSFKTVKSKKIGIMGIKYFPSFDDKRWAQFEASINKLKDTDSIIIDLRGNGGGDDSRGMQLVGKLAGRTIQKNEYATDIEGTESATYVLILNKITSKEITSSKESWLRYREMYEKKLNNASQQGGGPLEDQSTPEIRENTYLKPIFVLADRGCGSSGESTLQGLRQLKNVTVVGRNTAGTMHFGNQGSLILPHSRLKVSMSTKFIRFNDGSFIEKTGFTPDVLLPNGQDALEFVLSQKIK